MIIKLQPFFFDCRKIMVIFAAYYELKTINMNILIKIFFSVCLFAFISISRVSAQTLVLWHADGTSTDIELYTSPQIKFQNDKILITSTILDIEYPKEDVLTFTFKGTNTNINKITEDLKIQKEKGRLVLHGIKSNDKIALYNIKGIRLPINHKKSGDVVILPLSSIPYGVYLLSINGKISKFTKR